jgi:hypothetical protein
MYLKSKLLGISPQVELVSNAKKAKLKDNLSVHLMFRNFLNQDLVRYGGTNLPFQLLRG